jgi:hypothetical protein
MNGGMKLNIKKQRKNERLYLALEKLCSSLMCESDCFGIQTK